MSKKGSKVQNILNCLHITYQNIGDARLNVRFDRKVCHIGASFCDRMISNGFFTIPFGQVFRYPGRRWPLWFSFIVFLMFMRVIEQFIPWKNCAYLFVSVVAFFNYWMQKRCPSSLVLAEFRSSIFRIVITAILINSFCIFLANTEMLGKSWLFCLTKFFATLIVEQASSIWNSVK